MPDHWGEFISEERRTKPSASSLLKPCDYELSSYQPLCDETDLSLNVTKEETKPSVKSEKVTFTDGLVAHTIKLEQYRLHLHSLLAKAVQDINEGTFEKKGDEIEDRLDIPPCSNCKKQQDTIEEDVHEVEFARGIGVSPPSISPDTAVLLLRKSVAQICRHQGIQDAEPIALNALAGAAQTYYNKMLTQLRRNVDMEAIHGYTGFQDAMHRTLTQIGQNDIGTLLDDYYRSTIHRHDKLVDTCKGLTDVYTYILQTGEIPEQCSDLMPTIHRESSLSVFSLSEDMDAKSEAGGSVINLEDNIDEDDAQKLLELAGMSGFDITIEAEQDEPPVTTPSASLSPGSAVGTIAPPKGKGKSAGKGGAAAKRRKKQ